MKIPDGAGLWPAFWLYYSQRGGQAEIDAMEVCANPIGANGGDDVSLLHNAVHWGRGSHEAEVRTVDLSLDFHVYAIDWRPDHIAFYLDGVEVGRFTDVAHIPMVPLPLIVDLAVGGSSCGCLDGPHPEPIRPPDRLGARPAVTERRQGFVDGVPAASRASTVMPLTGFSLALPAAE